MKVTVDVKQIVGGFLMLPFLFLYGIAIFLGLITDLFITPFRWAATFLFNFGKEITK